MTKFIFVTGGVDADAVELLDGFVSCFFGEPFRLLQYFPVMRKSSSVVPGKFYR